MKPSLLGKAPSHIQTVLGFDWGEKKVGVAIGNTTTAQARPLIIIRPKNTQQLMARIAQLVTQWQPQLLVVGYPLTAEGKHQPATLGAQKLANRLHTQLRLPVDFVEEAYSSLSAKQLLNHNKEDEDDLAASIILQQWLDEIDQTTMV